MKDNKKHKLQDVKERSVVKLTLDESLDKFSGPEYAPEKLKEIEKKFSKGITIYK